MNKRAGVSWSIIVLLLAVVVALIFMTGFWLIVKDAIKDIAGIGYEHPELEENSYFEVTGVGFYNGNVGILPAGCSTSGTNKVSCVQNTDVEFYVIIKNTGANRVDVRASPRIAKDCKADSDECQEEYWLDGGESCIVVSGQSYDCRTVNTYKFDRKGNYRVYPGAKCPVTICRPPPNEPTQLPYVMDYNPQNYIDIQIR